MTQAPPCLPWAGPFLARTMEESCLLAMAALVVCPEVGAMGGGNQRPGCLGVLSSQRKGSKDGGP